VWKDVFAKAGQTYRAPTLVLFSGTTDSRCGGVAQSAMGPFYCPNDQKIYLDTSFFRQIETRFRGCDVGSKSCQFSQAYVIAHEVGHHVQNLLGILTRSQSAQQAAGGRSPEANRIQVRVELQADCLAGVWANRSDQRWNLLQPGDVEAALRTAAAIGDDTLQRRAQGRVVPDSFTHGTSEQRQRWFYTGLKQGTVESCNTFSSPQF
jgi:predicted metalloprotease